MPPRTKLPGRLAVAILFALTTLLFINPSAAQKKSSTRPSSGTLAGIVRDPAGKIVKGARVTLQPSDARAARVTQTDAEGRFAFTRLRPALYDVRAYSNGMWSDWKKNVQILPAARVDLSVRLNPAEKPAPPPSSPAIPPPPKSERSTPSPL